MKPPPTSVTLLRFDFGEEVAWLQSKRAEVSARLRALEASLNNNNNNTGDDGWRPPHGGGGGGLPIPVISPAAAPAHQYGGGSKVMPSFAAILDPFCPPFGRSVGWLGCHNFLKGRDSYTSLSLLEHLF